MKRDRLLVIGLGNPGKKYQMTRHNLGFMVVEELAKKLGWTWKKRESFSSYAASGEKEGVDLHLLAPQTYMNLSGQAVKKYADYNKFVATDMIVVADDVAIPFAEMRLRLQGGSGGHNGLKSIQECLSSSHFMRLRMGVGSEKMNECALDEFVLDDFSKEERAALPSFVASGVEALLLLLTLETHQVMTKVNQRKNENIRKKDRRSINESETTEPL